MVVCSRAPIGIFTRRLVASNVLLSSARLTAASSPTSQSFRRSFRSASRASTHRVPDFAFAFDIDGVLLRSATPIPGAHEALSQLQHAKIPFILLTNGGGKHESERVAELSDKLRVPLDVGMFIQSHTPFAALADENAEGSLRDKCVLVIGGDGDKCRTVAEQYGFRNVILPADIITAHPTLWPFAKALIPHYAQIARPLPRPINFADPDTSLKIDAVFVFNDPRDWALDTQIILDVLLSKRGIMGTLSSRNGDSSLPNRGFQQDGQPTLYFSNPDLWWAAEYALPRLGQGGFREAFEGVWSAVTGGSAQGVELQKAIIGKPYHATYEYAEKRLRQHRQQLLSGHNSAELRSVYMVGDNPESDIRGANDYRSPFGSKWHSMLVRTGVFCGGTPMHEPQAIFEDVRAAVQWALLRENHEADRSSTDT
ncbi:MAG: hypothetical protein M1817_004653 [Caeruleum heppii]|nr:MAG: hypothetical protein M1817_004653 [Caeruleum heppii]